MHPQYLLCVLLCVLTSLVQAQTQRPLSAVTVIERIKPAIVGVGSYSPIAAPKTHLYGTGFVIKNGRFVVTNLHVVESIQRKREGQLVIFYGEGIRSKAIEAQVLAKSKEHDLAILGYQGPRLPAVALHTELKPEGTDVLFTGFPIGTVLGLYPVTHRGMISSITPIATPADNVRQLSAAKLRRLKNPYRIYQLDATAYPGNSGSPVFELEKGRVIGVINKVFVKLSKESVLSNPSGITYAIPSARIEELILRGKLE